MDGSTRHSDVDWYSVVVPDGQDVLTFRSRTAPARASALTLQDDGGSARPPVRGPADDPADHHLAARVRPGTYRVQVEQPVLSTAFTFDTSGSMAEFVPNVREALRAFVRGIKPGRRGGQAATRSAQPALTSPTGRTTRTSWSSSSTTAVVDGRSSAAEHTMTPAAKALARRSGSRAMLVLTDAETTSYDENTDALGAARRRPSRSCSPSTSGVPATPT